MRLLVIILMILLTSKAWAQNSRFAIGVEGGMEGINYAFKKSPLNTHYTYSENALYSFGLVGTYQPTDLLIIKSGLMYTQQEYATQFNFVFLQANDPSIPKERRVNVSYLRVPLRLGFRLVLAGNFNFSPAVGTDFNFKLNHSEITVYEDGREAQTQYSTSSLNNMVTNIKLDLEMGYGITQHLRVTFIPSLGVGLSPIDEELMDSGQLLYGLALGVKYYF